GIEEGLPGEQRLDGLLVRCGSHGRVPPQSAVMIVPTCSPARARVTFPGTSPLMTCTDRTNRADFIRSKTGNSMIESCKPRALSSSTVISGMNSAFGLVLGLAL